MVRPHRRPQRFSRARERGEGGDGTARWGRHVEETREGRGLGIFVTVYVCYKDIDVTINICYNF